MNIATKPAPALRIRSWRYRISEHDLRQRVEVSDDGRPLATTEVSTAGPGGTGRVSLHAEPGHTTPGCRASLVEAGTVTSVVEATGKIVEDLRYINRSGSATNVSPTANI